MNIKELEEEALEVNRLYNNYQMLRKQHREKIIDQLALTEEGAEAKELARILLITMMKEEGE